LRTIYNVIQALKIKHNIGLVGFTLLASCNKIISNNANKIQNCHPSSLKVYQIQLVMKQTENRRKQIANKPLWVPTAGVRNYRQYRYWQID